MKGQDWHLKENQQGEERKVSEPVPSISTSVKQRMGSIGNECTESQAASASYVASLLFTPAQLAATCVQMAKTSCVVQCEAILQDMWPDTDSDFRVCMVAEVNEQTTDDV